MLGSTWCLGIGVVVEAVNILLFSNIIVVVSDVFLKRATGGSV